MTMTEAYSNSGPNIADAKQEHKPGNVKDKIPKIELDLCSFWSKILCYKGLCHQFTENNYINIR
jgi:hypothetical protein